MDDVALPYGDPRPAPRGRSLALRAALSATLLAALVWRVDLGAVGETFFRFGPPTLALTLVLSAVSVVCWALRWQRILAHLGERVALTPLLGDLLVGMTFNLLLPSSVGGDVVRAHRCAGRLATAANAWASVLFERLLGLLALVLLAVVGLLAWAGAEWQPLLHAAVALAGALLLATLLGARPLRWGAGLLKGRLARFSAPLLEVAAALEGPLGRWGVRLETLVLSLLFQGVALSLLVPPALGWDDPGLLAGIYFGVPIALVATVLPVTLGGLGLRESLFVVVLAPFGVSAERALALALVWLLAMVAASMPGLLLVGRRPV